MKWERACKKIAKRRPFVGSQINWDEVCHALQIVKDVFVDGKYIVELNAIIDHVINEMDGLDADKILLRDVIAKGVPIKRVGIFEVVHCENEEAASELGLQEIGKGVVAHIYAKEINEADPKKVEQFEEEMEKRGCVILARVPTLF